MDTWNYLMCGLTDFNFSSSMSPSFMWSAMTYYRFPELIISVLKDKYSHLKLSK